MQPETKTETKTEHYDGLAQVAAVGTACRHNMPWESPWVKFEMHGGGTALWHSDNIPTIASAFGFPNWQDMKGRWVHLNAHVRSTPKGWRVQRISDILDL